MIFNFEFDNDFVIFENDFQMKIRIHENVHEFAINHVMTFENKKNVIDLIELNNAIDAISNDFQIQIIIAKIHVCHFESFVENDFDLSDNDFIDVHNKNVVHVKNDDNFDFVINKNVMIDIDLNEFKNNDVCHVMSKRQDIKSQKT